MLKLSTVLPSIIQLESIHFLFTICRGLSHSSYVNEVNKDSVLLH